MDTYYDRLNAFYRANRQSPLSAHEQLVMLHLLQLNNEHGNCGQFYLSDVLLAERTQVPKSEITPIKRNLKNAGLIDFRTNPHNPRAGTLYTLPPLKKSGAQISTNQPETGQYRSTNSEEVKKAWRECAGEELTGGRAFGMIQLENAYGTKAVVDAIIKADQSNTQPRLTFNYVKAILENAKKGANANAKRKPAGGTAVRSAQRREEFHDDEFPPEYQYLIENAQAFGG